MNHLLFVYGSLRSDTRRKPAIDLRRFGSRLGRATVRGTLYRLSPRYPGLAEGDRPVAGELWRLHRPAAALRFLDRYEGPGFPRLLMPVRFRNGRRAAWIYRFAGNPAGRQRIREWR